MKNKTCILAIFLICVILSSCTANKTDTEEIASASRDIFAMDTYMSVTCYGENAQEAVNAAIDEITRLDSMLSVGNEDSIIYRLNDTGSVQLTDEAAEMVEEAISVYETTDGALDITVYPLMELWGFTTGDYNVPSKEDIENTLKSVGTDLIDYDSENKILTLSQGQGLDLGAVAKGYTSAEIMKIFEEYDVVSGLVSLGGNIQCYKTKTDGSLWKCGIRDADGSDNLLGVVNVENKAVITSGGYERYFVDEETNTTYHHIIDPKTGYPANNGIVSSTIVSDDGMLADCLSTACYIMGLDRAVDYWKKRSDFDFVFMTDNREIYVSEGLEDCFASDYDVIVVRK